MEARWSLSVGSISGPRSLRGCQDASLRATKNEEERRQTCHQSRPIIISPHFPFGPQSSCLQRGRLPDYCSDAGSTALPCNHTRTHTHTDTHNPLLRAAE